MKDYRIMTFEEQEEAGIYEMYSVLIGPDDFECTLTEPEDRMWGRDGRPVVDKLNELAARIEELEEECKEER